MTDRPSFISSEKPAAKPKRESNGRQEGPRGEQSYRPTSNEDIERGRAARAADANTPPEQRAQVASGFALTADILSASIEGDMIHTTIRFEGLVQRPEAMAEVFGHSMNIAIPATVTRWNDVEPA